MANKSKRTIADHIGAAQIAIGNTQNDSVIQARVSAYGFDETRMNEGKQIYEKAVSALNAQIAAAGALRDATASCKAAQTSAQTAFQDLSQVARAAFAHDKPRLAALGLTGAMPRKTASFLVAAFALFDNALNLPEIKTVLEKYGYDQTKLQNERARIVAYETINQAQEAAKGAARQATREQDTALKNLRNWMSQFVKIAKVALRDNKELLAKLGILTTGAGRPGRKSAEKTPESGANA